MRKNLEKFIPKIFLYFLRTIIYFLTLALEKNTVKLGKERPPVYYMFKALFCRKFNYLKGCKHLIYT